MGTKLRFFFDISKKMCIFAAFFARMEQFLTKYDPTQRFILTDEHVFPLLSEIGLSGYPTLVLPSGEIHKSLDSVQRIWDFLIEHDATRRAVLVNVGGGVITDMGGFAASTFKRGIDFINVPTTVLAMVDAAGGGKTGFDYRGLKNEIGVFRQSVYTHVDSQLLRTLPVREVLSGLAEMIKHALIADAEEFGKLMTIGVEDNFASEFFAERIVRSAAIKDRIVAEDPLETGLRKVLNFGHTIGHALESVALERGYNMTHGYAVMYGLIAELYISHVKMGLPSSVITQVTHFVIENYGKIVFSCKDYDKLLNLMQHDKKNLRPGEINFTLLKAVGEPCINQVVAEPCIREALDYLFTM